MGYIQMGSNATKQDIRSNMICSGCGLEYSILILVPGRPAPGEDDFDDKCWLCSIEDAKRGPGGTARDETEAIETTT